MEWLPIGFFRPNSLEILQDYILYSPVLDTMVLSTSIFWLFWGDCCGVGNSLYVEAEVGVLCRGNLSHQFWKTNWHPLPCKCFRGSVP